MTDSTGAPCTPSPGEGERLPNRQTPFSAEDVQVLVEAYRQLRDGDAVADAVADDEDNNGAAAE